VSAAALREAAGYALPTAALVLLPKCPACLAAYLAIGAGIGVTVATAAALRWALLGLSVGSLAVLAARRIGRVGSARRERAACRCGPPTESR